MTERTLYDTTETETMDRDRREDARAAALDAFRESGVSTRGLEILAGKLDRILAID